MKHPRMWTALCLMTVFYQLGTSANRYGCLFEKRLCSRQELCLSDGLFGRCQDPLTRERVLYEVSVPVLHRLQEVLKQLMMLGLSWQDDITQYIISQEMARVPRVYSSPSSKEADVDKSLQPSSGKLSYLGSRPRPGPDQLSPSLIQRYLDYMVPDPYSYRKYGYQDSKKQLGALSTGDPRPGSLQGGSRQSDRDRQLMRDLLMLYLSGGDASSQPGAAATPYYQDDYTQDYRRGKSKDHIEDYGDLRPLDDPVMQRLRDMLDKHGIDLRDLSDQQLASLTAVLQLLQGTQESTDHFEDNATLIKKEMVTEGHMMHLGETETDPSEKQTDQESPDTTSGQPALGPLTGSPDSPDKESKGGVESSSVPQVENKSDQRVETTGIPAHHKEEYGYIVTNQKPLSLFDGVRLLETLAERIHLTTSTFINISVVGPALTFRIRQNNQNMSVDDVANKAVAEKTFLESETGLKIIQTGVGERNEGHALALAVQGRDTSRWLSLTLIGVACVGGILLTAFTIACLRHHFRQHGAGKLGLWPEGGSNTHFEYQELCRQHMAAKTSFSRQEAGGTDTSRVSSVSSQFSDAPQASPSSHSSTPSWCEEPAQSNMDISTGHMILAYMEDHLKNKDRLQKEWEALCSYQAEPSICSVAQSEANLKKNRNPDFVPYDHARVKLKAEINPSRTDFINASTIIEHDPKMPAYIATQGPLSHTIADFWQMVWENGCTVIVMMTPLVEDGEKQCDRYWPDEGSSLYHIYEVNLVSEHIWCEDFLVRSFYLKNVQSQETRTLTQFHFLSWPAQGIPTSTRPLLDFRRKVNKCYRGRSCPIIVHCSDGAGRAGTYILIDMVLNRMAKGVKEIDIAATLEHIRDQRPGMVRTKDQFEFALTAVAEEVNAILKALPQ
ncbi:protein tyrosine phosphatase receptor type Na isoform X1 [Polyodon spathula]|uniref:protein tyrosine phosphatase receptor type Na isoform X1 n=1 Tax=Polyodon spathula TaxID=7913 RepID=UPI001B7E722A|nr:protein tyrosine phosphatase receptor type Na isoform X1 [Polyodon spathula]